MSLLINFIIRGLSSSNWAKEKRVKSYEFKSNPRKGEDFIIHLPY